MKKYLIFQFACFGDCLIATAVAHQIRHDSPDCHITWAIASKYKSILEGNPHVDSIMELDIDPKIATNEQFLELQQKLDRIELTRDFDEIVHLQIFDRHLTDFYTTLRKTVFSIYGKPMTVDISPVVCLSEIEVRNVEIFAKRHRLDTYSSVILFECAPGSGQSRMTPDLAKEVATQLTRSRNDICIILSSPLDIKTTNPRIINGSSISFRENLALAKHCTLLVGCSSGITWLCTAALAKRIPMIQLLENNSPIFAGVNFDFEINGLDNSHIIEMTDFTENDVVCCITHVVNHGITASRSIYNQDCRPNHYNLTLNLRRLVWQKYPLNAIYSYARNFVSENRRFGNDLNIGILTIMIDICNAYFQKARSQLKGCINRLKSVSLIE